jgi:hypothetical protein
MLHESGSKSSHSLLSGKGRSACGGFRQGRAQKKARSVSGLKRNPESSLDEYHPEVVPKHPLVEATPFWLPSAYQHRPDWAANAIGSDKPATRKVPDSGTSLQAIDYGLDLRSDHALLVECSPPTGWRQTSLRVADDPLEGAAVQSIVSRSGESDRSPLDASPFSLPPV